MCFCKNQYIFTSQLTWTWLTTSTAVKIIVIKNKAWDLKKLRPLQIFVRHRSSCCWTQASLFSCIKCVINKIPFTNPATHSLYGDKCTWKGSHPPILFLLTRCPQWRNWWKGSRPSCSSCSLRSSSTTSSQMWCLWQQPVRSSSRARVSPNYYRSPWSWGILWTLAHEMERHLVSPYLTCAR